MMKRLFGLILLLSGLMASAQVQNNNLPDCQLAFSFQVTANVITAIKDTTGQALPAGSSKLYDNRSGVSSSSVGCNLWHLQYSIDGVSAVSIEVDTALDASGPPASGAFSVWPATQVASGVLPLTAVTGLNKGASVYGFPDWVRVFLNSATGTGTVFGQLMGWRPQGTSDTTSGATPVNPATFQFKHISTNTNTQVKATSGVLHTIQVNTSAAGAVTIVDTSAANCSGGTTIGVATLVANAAGTQETFTYDVSFVNGLCITTAASPDLTVSFK